MTVICWDGKELAADRRSLYGAVIHEVTKIWRIGDVLVGGAGDYAQVLEMAAWVRAGRDVAAFPSSQRSKDDWAAVLLIEVDGTVLIYERTPYPVKVESLPVAIGSGKEFARAAMHCGRSPREAVLVANALTQECGNGVDVLTLE
jgi:hypothetical protein